MSGNPIRFSDAAFAIETPLKTFRKLIENPSLVLPLSRSGGWQEFSMLQIAVLALTRRMVDFGNSVAESSMMACTIAMLPQYASKKQIAKLSPAGFLKALDQDYCLIWKRSGVFESEIVRSKIWPQPPDRLRSTAVLTLPIAAVIERAFSRLAIKADASLLDDDDALIGALMKFRVEISDTVVSIGE